MLPVNVALFETHPLFEAALQAIIGSCDDLLFIGRIDDGLVNRSLGRQEPAIVVMQSDAAEVHSVDRVHERFPGVKVLLLCRNQDAHAICAAFQNGVHGCLSERSTPDELVRAIKCVARGEQYLSPTLAMHLLSGAVQKPAVNADPFASLTDREEQIVKLLGIGLSNKEIGWRLTISEKTVKHYLTSILGKLNVRNRVQAALLAAGRPEPLSYA